MLPSGDTIAAVATPMGAGGVGIIRISGSKAADIVSSVLGVTIASLRNRYLAHGHVQDGGSVVDEVLYVLMRGPQSFTGEDVAEIHGHGGSANMGRLLKTVLGAGARHAEAGEFTRRAFENQRLDLTRAEAIIDIVNASSARSLRVAQSQLQGQLGDLIAGLRSDLIALLAEVEADIDFPDESLRLEDKRSRHKRADDAARQCESLAESYGLGEALRDGVDVVLRGSVNAGKSSLFNALVGVERAIVDAMPGTTRDFVEAQVVWDGIEVTLIDTAGERQGQSRIENRGVELGRERAAQADIELVVVPASETVPEISGRQLLVMSKCDLGAPKHSQGLRTSVTNGVGVTELRAAILQKVVGAPSESADGIVVTSERQRRRLEEAAIGLSTAGRQILADAPAELIVVDLRSSLHSLAEITGEEVGDEMLDELFSRFCVGK